MVNYFVLKMKYNCIKGVKLTNISKNACSIIDYGTNLRFFWSINCWTETCRWTEIHSKISKIFRIRLMMNFSVNHGRVTAVIVINKRSLNDESSIVFLGYITGKIHFKDCLDCVAWRRNLTRFVTSLIFTEAICLRIK